MVIKKTGLIILALILALSLPVLAQEGTQQTQEKAQQTQPGGGIVAEVNGEKLTMADLEQLANTQQLIMQLFQTNREFAQLLYSTEAGQKVLNEYRKRKLDQLIEQKLLQQKAEEKDIKLTEKEKEEYFKSHIEQIKAQNNISEEELINALKQQGVGSLDSYRKLFMDNSNLVVNKLLEKEVYDSIEVTEEEAKKVYDEEKKNGKYQDQSFADVKEQIINNLRQQKQQQVRRKYINDLKQEADIEKKL